MQNVDKMTRNCLQWVLCYNLLRYCSLQFHSTRVPEIWKHLAECFFLCTSIRRLDYQPLFVYMFSKLLSMQSVQTSWIVSAFQTVVCSWNLVGDRLHVHCMFPADSIPCGGLHLYHTAASLSPRRTKNFFFCPSSLALDERLDGQNLLF